MLASRFSPTVPSLFRTVTAAAPLRVGRRWFTPSTAAAASDMFCFQCEQTEGGTGCTTVGVCGKTPETAAIQDLLVHQVKGLAQQAKVAQAAGVDTSATDDLVLNSLFSTLTNVNFSASRIKEYIDQVEQHKKDLADASGTVVSSPFYDTTPLSTLDELHAQGREVGVLTRGDPTTDNILGLQELLTYGLKGLAAYSAHALALGKSDPSIPAFVYEAMDYLAKPVEEQTVEGLLGLALKCGEVNITATGLLNEGHVGKFGVPEPTKVRTTGIKGKALLVSGHDLADLEAVLQQTEGTGVNVYTHGEMLPGHGYPGLKKYPHLVGNYGGAWQMQKLDFAMFPGSILMTTNCLVEPSAAYADRIYTTNAVGFDGVPHLSHQNFKAVVDRALECDGFEEDEREAYTMTGFGHQAVLGVAGDVLEAIGDGRIKNFFLIGGCDGSESERSYYKKLAKSVPADGVVMSLGCAKYRFNKLDFGMVEGTSIPRYLDIGQCNDAYSAVQIAVALANALDTDVNSLPLHMAISWFEQKAVAVLLSLLHLGIQDIHIGPKLPAFVTPDVLSVLVDKWNLTPIGDAKTDLKKFLGEA